MTPWRVGLRGCVPTPPSHTHLAPGAGPGWLPGLGGLPEREVIGGPLLTQALCRDAQVACGRGERGIISVQGCVSYVFIGPPPLPLAAPHPRSPRIRMMTERSAGVRGCSRGPGSGAGVRGCSRGPASGAGVRGCSRGPASGAGMRGSSRGPASGAGLTGCSRGPASGAGVRGCSRGPASGTPARVGRLLY